MAVQRFTNISHRVALLRIIFGVVWGIDATLKWQPAFLHSFAGNIMMAAQGQPSWLEWWFNLWMHPLMAHPYLCAIITAITESLIALALLLGAARKWAYVGGAVFAFLIWGIGEGFGGPYEAGASDIGAAVIYIFVFWALYELDKIRPSGWALDTKIAKIIPWWQRIATVKSQK